MRFLKSSTGYILRLDKGEEVMTHLSKFCADQNIRSGWINAIGAVCEVQLGYYDLQAKTYLKKKFSDVFELASFQGNISLTDGQPFCHAHVVLGGRDFTVRAGHLFKAKVAVTFEAKIIPDDFNLQRKFDDQVGLKLWDME